MTFLHLVCNQLLGKVISEAESKMVTLLGKVISEAESKIVTLLGKVISEVESNDPTLQFYSITFII